MTPRLKELLERRKAKADTPKQQPLTIKEETDTGIPISVLIPSWSDLQGDMFSPFF